MNAGRRNAAGGCITQRGGGDIRELVVKEKGGRRNEGYKIERRRTAFCDHGVSAGTMLSLIFHCLCFFFACSLQFSFDCFNL